MSTTEPRIDAYITKAQPFARPILEEVRRRVHQALPKVEEAIKWGMPFFLVDGKIVATMAGFKAHARVGIWTAGVNGDPRFVNVTSVAELAPAKEFKALLLGAVERRAADAEAKAVAKASGAKPAKKKPVAQVKVPAALAAALKKAPKAKAAFAALAPSHRNEYSRWIAEAKQDETRARRVEKALALIADGKHRNWQYDR